MSCVITSGVLFLGGILVLLACGYGHKPFFPEPPPNKPYSSFVVELNDYGTFWSRDKAQDALNEVDRQSKETNTIVVLYVHGWHHNAAPDNSNLAAFHKSLEELKDKLDKKPYEDARLELTGKADVKVIGIYLGCVADHCLCSSIISRFGGAKQPPNAFASILALNTCW